MFQLDYDNASVDKFYTLNVAVADRGSNTATCNLDVALQPINEAPVCEANFVAGAGEYIQPEVKWL